MPWPCSPSRARARSTTSRTSFTPAVTADSGSNAFAGRARDEPGDRRLAGARRSPEDDGREPVGLDQDPQRPPGAEELLLADDLVERSRPQPGRQRGPAPQPVLDGGAEEVVGHRASGGGSGMGRGRPYHRGGHGHQRDLDATRPTGPWTATAHPVGVVPGAPRERGRRVGRALRLQRLRSRDAGEGRQRRTAGPRVARGTVVDGSGWRVEIVVSIEKRTYRTTAAADGTYEVVDVPSGHATVAWSATSTTAGSSGPTVGEARRDGSLGVDLTAGKNHVDIQL